MAELKGRSGVTVEPERDYVVMASRLPLKRFWMMPQFFRYTLAIRKQLREAEGMVWYSLVAELSKRRFWTLSVWENEGALRDFVRRLPHSHVMQAVRPHMSGQRFVQWRMPGSAFPPSWDEAHRRLEDGV